MLIFYNKIKKLSTNYIKYLSIFLITGFLLTLAAPLSFAQQDQGFQELPQTIEEAKPFSERILRSFLDTLKRIWQEALTTWKTIITPFFQNIWYRINSFFGREIEKIKPEIRKELEEEKEEIKEEAPRVGKSLWERFKKLIE